MIPAVLLCDADDCLWGSETIAFAASAGVVNRFLAAHGVDERYAGDELRRRSAGRNFRGYASSLAQELGFTADDLDGWVEEERRVVTRALAAQLRPDPAVSGPLSALAAAGHRLACVSSSALLRLDACFEATGLGELFPPAVRFSAEDSLPVPTSKPDPAVYALAVRELGVDPATAMAVEDSVSGVRSAVGAGVRAIGNLQFVPAAERAGRREALLAAGAADVVEGWDALAV